jgi:ubiquinone/menaquinone biosynthesis C-methylase UbiE
MSFQGNPMTPMIEERYYVKPKVANKYDTYIGDNIPFYWGFMRFIAESLRRRFAGRGPLDSVELGSGSANLSISVGRAVRLGNLTLVDHSERFLEIARGKLEENGTSLHPPRFKHASFLDPGWDDDLAPGGQDLVLSSLTLDHIVEDDAFVALLARVRRLLRPGGCFVMAEKCSSPDPATPSWRSFARMIHLRGENNLRHGFKTAEEIARWKEHNFEEDVMRPFAQLWSFAERAGLAVAAAGGVALPEAERMTYDDFYELREVVPLTRDEVFASAQAFGVAVLVCEAT